MKIVPIRFSVKLFAITTMVFFAGSIFSQTVEAGDDRSICLGDDVQLMAEDAISYEWNPTTGLSDPEIANPVASPTETTSYILNSIDLDGTESFDTLTVFVISSLDFDAGNNQTICQGQSANLGSDAQLDVSYTWTPDSTLSSGTISNPVASPLETTTYMVLAENGSCQSQSEVTISVTYLKVDFDYILFPSCNTFDIQLVNKSDPAPYQWNFWDGSSTSEISPILTSIDPNEDIFVTLRETSSSCNFNKTIDINLDDIDDYINFSATNVFSPNGDGINDFMSIGLDGNLENCMEFIIYNRWGERVFVSTGGNSRWDGYTLAGQLSAAGVYFYTVNIKGVEYRGTVQIL